MSDQFVETTNTSFSGRVSQSFGGVVIGLIAFIGSFYLLAWNEGRAIRRAQTLDYGMKIVQSIPSNNINPEYNDKLIHIYGNATTSDILDDSAFGVKEKAIKLKRNVLMYQWKEDQSSNTTNNADGSQTTETTYTYSKTWSPLLISSSNFKKQTGHVNPSNMPYSNDIMIASKVSVNAFTVSNDFVGQINNFNPYQLSQSNYDAMSDSMKSTFKLSGNEYFYGDQVNPQIGDLRVSFEIVKPSEVSIVGKQVGNIVQQYYTKTGNIALLEYGQIEAEEMFDDAKHANVMLTWGLRLLGWVVMLIGISLILRPLSVLSSFVPFLGYIIEYGMGLIAIVSSLFLSIITIAIAWFAYRPVISSILFGLAFLLFGGGLKWRRKNVMNNKTDYCGV